MPSLLWDDPLPKAKGKTAHQLIIENGPTLSPLDLVALLKKHGFATSSRSVHVHRAQLGVKGPGHKLSEIVNSNEASETHELHGNQWVIDIRGTRFKSLPEILAHCQVDTREWRVEKFIINKWEVGRRDKKVSMAWTKGKADGYVEDSGKIFVEPLWQVKVWLARKVEVLGIQTEIAALKTLALSLAIRPAKIAARRFTQADHLLELSIPDAHIGQLSEGSETGHDDYTLRLAQDIFKDAIETLVARTASFQFSKVCLTIGNDLMNFDNLAGTTTHGTPQSNSARYYTVFGAIRDLIIGSVHHLRKVAPVRVIVVQGNHDETVAWHLGDLVRSFFNRYKDVEVDHAPRPRKYVEFGSTMLMWTHGDKTKRAKYPLLMATEQPEMFGRTKFREAHDGHTHELRMEEHNGVRVRTIPSLAPPSDWSSGKGFIGNIREAEAFVWSKTEGLVSTTMYVVPDKFKRAK